MKAPNLQVPVHNANLFTWLGRRGATEASCLSRLPGTRFMSRAWDDSCDIGFFVANKKTGTKRLFLVTGETRRDGEVTGWLLTSSDDSGEEVVEVTVFND